MSSYKSMSELMQNANNIQYGLCLHIIKKNVLPETLRNDMHSPGHTINIEALKEFGGHHRSDRSYCDFSNAMSSPAGRLSSAVAALPTARRFIQGS